MKYQNYNGPQSWRVRTELKQGEKLTVNKYIKLILLISKFFWLSGQKLIPQPQSCMPEVRKLTSHFPQQKADIYTAI